MPLYFDDINKKLDEIQNLLDRTYWRIEIKNRPNRMQRFIAKVFFKSEFKSIIKERGEN